jgi:exodeoxyribonuclease-3
VRLLVFNAQHASPGRARRQAEWIAAQERADALVISEVGSGPGGAALIGALTDGGYPSVLAPGPSFAGYGTVLASRAAALTVVPSGIGVLPDRGLAAAFTLAGQRIALLGLYVPSRGPKERRNEDKRAFQRAVTMALPGFLARFGGPVIVAGDLNVVEPGHIPHHAVFGDWEYGFYRSFADAGLTDAYRPLHPDAAGHSWFGRSGQGCRFDHAFVTTRHDGLIRSCRYLQEPRELGLTDHAAMAVSLGPIHPTNSAHQSNARDT